MPGSSGVAGAARIRLMGDSYVYASPGMVSTACRHSVTLLLSVTEAPVAVGWRIRQAQGTALLVAPLVQRQLLASGVPFVLLDLEPSHSSFRRFALAFAQGDADSAVQCLHPAQVASLRQVVHDFHAGRAGGPELDGLVRAGVTALAAHWPDPGPLDPRVAWMMRTMNCEPSVSLACLARELSMSATRASRLFTAQMGIPSRAYAMASKVRAAARCMGSGLSLTDVALAAGFADSAHFAKVWLRCYGGPPSLYFPAWRTEMDAAGLPDWSGWAPPRPSLRQAG